MKQYTKYQECDIMKNMKRSKIRGYKSYCSEPLDKIEHYEEASAEDFAGWCIHHRLEIQPDGTRVSAKELIDQNLYYGRPASELVFMRNGEHSYLHNKDKVISAKTRQKIAEARKGKAISAEHRKKISEALSGENNPFFGKHLSAETRQKMSEARKGRHKSAEARQKMSEAHKGKLWWNNGISNKCCRECPGEGWTRGILKFK